VRLKRKLKIMNRKPFKFDEKEKPYRCPCCHKILYKAAYHEEYWGYVEGGYICRACGYEDYFEYGDTMLVVGDWHGGYTYKTPYKEVRSIRREFERQIIRWKRERKWFRRMYYARKKRQGKRVM
jgi:hypothetical protein